MEPNLIVALVPAFNPNEQLVKVVEQLSGASFSAVIVVNDGSSAECDPIFTKVSKLKKVVLLHNAVNLGKGAALKNGLNYAYAAFPNMLGVVTVDADGQHLIEDVVKIAAKLKRHPTSLVIGSRCFSKKHRVPWRSKIGNLITKDVFHLLIGKKIEDTQSGLRGIPRALIPDLLNIEAQRYEFELDMLILCRKLQYDIIEERIKTIYIANNQSSHFKPLIDSMKIYFVLLRFLCVSLSSSLVDYLVFGFSYLMGLGVGQSMILARATSTSFNYFFVKKFAFISKQQHRNTLVKYLALVVVSGFFSYLLIIYLVKTIGLSVIEAKLLAESIVFVANFAIQRDFIFTDKKIFGKK